jgi:hypothetical protein
MSNFCPIKTRAIATDIHNWISGNFLWHEWTLAKIKSVVAESSARWLGDESLRRSGVVLWILL